MMAESRWIEISFLLIPVLQITAVPAQYPPSFIVRVGDEVSLHCENVIDDHHQCDSTTWLFGGSEKSVTLFEHGRVREDANPDRLSATENCSLVIKKVTAEDAGYYTCRQFRSGQQQGPDSQVLLSVVNMTEHKNKMKVTFSCCVLTSEARGYTVKWLRANEGVITDNKDIKTSQSTCAANVTIETSHFISNNYESLKCSVTDSYTGEVHLFTLNPRSSGKDTGEDTNSATATTKSPVRTTNKSVTVGRNRRESTNNDSGRKSQVWWWYIIVAAGLAGLLIIVVAVVICRRTKANGTQMDDNAELTSNPAVIQSAPETREDTADPEDGVSYASISHTKKTDREARVRGGDEAVTYSTVRAPSSSAGASADPSDLYATIN